MRSRSDIISSFSVRYATNHFPESALLTPLCEPAQAVRPGNRTRLAAMSPLFRLAGLAVAAGLAGLSVGGAAAAATKNIDLLPGQNVQSVVNSAPEGTIFVFLPGIHRMQSIEPKNNDVFAGTPGAILNGSEVLKFSQVSSENVWVASVTVLPTDSGQCQTTRPLCNVDQDLFVDGVLQTPAAQLSGLASPRWYFDREHGFVFIAENPAGHTVELGMTQFAFSGTASGVQVISLVVQEYANPAQTGAIGGYKDGSGWIVNDVESRYNHGTGISLGPGGQILNSFSHNNGQMGVGIVNGTGSVVSRNEISWNNYAGYGIGWEAGGSKFWNTTNLVVENNYVHDNYGAGLWTDFDNVGTVYKSNVVEYNTGAGILHEISYDATIQSNTVENNGIGTDSLFTYSQILIENSSGVNVVSNTLEVPGGTGGIGLVNQQRGTGSQGSWVTANNTIHNNFIVYWSTSGFSGIVDYLGNGTAVGNQFDYDHYLLENGGTTHWMWFNKMTWPQLQGSGQEAHGVCN